MAQCGHTALSCYTGLLVLLRILVVSQANVILPLTQVGSETEVHVHGVEGGEQDGRICAVPERRQWGLGVPLLRHSALWAILSNVSSSHQPINHYQSHPLPSIHIASRTRRSVHEVYHRGPRYLQVKLVTDHSVVSFHGNSLVEQYLLTMLNLVDEVYHHPSLRVEINVAVVNIEILSDRMKNQLIVRHDGKRTLDNFCRWSDRIKPRDRNSEDNFDVAVYITRENIGPAGYAPVTGMCQSIRSCAVVKDDGITTAFVVAHEIGHIFGMQHDGYGNRCERSPDDGKIMATNVQSNYDNYYWTDCSRDDLEKYIDYMHCLHDKPLNSLITDFSQPYGQSWSLNEQCRQEFGDDFRLCTAFQHMDPCEHLWCSTAERPLFCKTKRSPPLPGTACGENKWCIKGKCELIRHVARDGGWSGWSSWGTCSRTCGTGVQYRSRTCSRPVPEHGGRECRGRAEELQLCNTEPCLLTVDFRAEQCSKQNHINFVGGRRHHWLPLENTNASRQCQLTCVSAQLGVVMVTEAYVIDGTFCSYNVPNNICIKGNCQNVGCDGVLDSNAREDACGVCNGDGSTCKTIRGAMSSPLTKMEYHHMVTLPVKARNIMVQERYATPHLVHFIAVRDPATEHWYLNGHAEDRGSTSFVVHGTNFIYTNGRHGESLQARGPLMAPVEIMVYSMSSNLAPTIDYEYLLGLEEAEEVLLQSLHPDHHNNIDARLTTTPSSSEEDRYLWVVKGWTQCSKTCGGGTHYEQFECLDRLQHTIVKGMCSLKTKPKAETAPCNEHSCNYKYRWLADPWEPRCSATCGDNGMQQRRLHCMAYVGPGQEREVDPPYCTRDEMPSYQQPCNRFPCDLHWNAGEWSECSVSCGSGTKSRDVKCTSRSNSNLDNVILPCPHSSKPANTSDCRMPPCLNPSKKVTIQTATELKSSTVLPSSSSPKDLFEDLDDDKIGSGEIPAEDTGLTHKQTVFNKGTLTTSNLNKKQIRPTKEEVNHGTEQQEPDKEVQKEIVIKINTKVNGGRSRGKIQKMNDTSLTTTERTAAKTESKNTPQVQISVYTDDRTTGKPSTYATSPMTKTVDAQTSLKPTAPTSVSVTPVRYRVKKYRLRRRRRKGSNIIPLAHRMRHARVQ